MKFNSNPYWSLNDQHVHSIVIHLTALDSFLAQLASEELFPHLSNILIITQKNTEAACNENFFKGETRKGKREGL